MIKISKIQLNNFSRMLIFKMDKNKIKINNMMNSLILILKPNFLEEKKYNCMKNLVIVNVVKVLYFNVKVRLANFQESAIVIIMLNNKKKNKI